MASTELKTVITADDKATPTVKKFGASVSNIAKGVALGTLAVDGLRAGVNLLTNSLKSSLQSFEDSEAAGAQLEAVLKSTGKAAGITRKDLDAQSSALEKMTTFSDEAVASAQSMLLTFTNVKGGVFKESIPVILDMSQALGQDLKSSSIQLGKALNDPIQGITALRRVGVAFSDDQQKVIEKLVNTGKVAEAQRLILKELNTEFGGSAKAAGDTFAGSMARLENQIDNVKESIGQLIVRVLTPLISNIAQFVASVDWDAVMERAADALKNLEGQMRRFLTPIAIFISDHKEQLIDGIKRFGEALLIVMPIVGILTVAMTAFSSPITLVIAAVIALRLAWDFLKAKFEEGGPIVESLKLIVQVLWQELQNLWHVIQEQLVPALQQLWKQIAPLLLPALKILGEFAGAFLVAAFLAFVALLTDVVNQLASFIQRVNTVIDSLKKIWEWVNKVTSGFFGLKDILKEINFSNLGIGLHNLLGKISGRASGGPIEAGRPYIVGEKGPELIVPRSSGMVMPNGGGGITINMNGNNSFSSEMDITTFTEMLARQIRLNRMGA